MKLFSLLAAFGLAALALSPISGAVAPAQAQNSVTLRKGELPAADKFYTAPRILQIVDDRDRIHDCRRPEPAPRSVVIPIGPVGSAPVDSVGSGVKFESNNLPQSGFGQSNIPARGMGPAVALPVAKMGGLSPVDKVRPIGGGFKNAQGSQSGVSGRIPTATAPAATYDHSYQSGSGLLGGSSGSSHKVSENVMGVLRGARGGK
ncbi:MAG: hypothetical protein JSS83_27810 [Cyanobacteria bacterium SZAS LIN-3]|nr:hypothetical protein [Cyanobacteria bacterium SZAS LIN-3]